MSQREFDIVVYGATGFVGKLTAEYLAKAGGTARIALAGRSPDKLAAVRATLGEAAGHWPILTVDADRQNTLEDMAARTRVVVTTVGPYSKYGLPLVAACAAAGTDYGPARVPAARSRPGRPQSIWGSTICSRAARTARLGSSRRAHAHLQAFF